MPTRTLQMCIRLSAEERKLIDQLADQTGLGAADIVRQAVRQLASSYGVACGQPNALVVVPLGESTPSQ
jgi:hypothetical protein